jgi:lipopolysaccharide transport system permease protein
MWKDLKKLVAYRDLLFNWAKREIKVRYKQSLLGVAWAILQPLSMTVVFTVVFSLFARIPTEGIPYPIFAYSALLPWTFFANALSFAVPSLVTNMNLVTKIYFPREIFPLASTLASFFDFLVASLIFFGMMVYYGVVPSPLCLLVPLVLVVQVALTVGIALLASAINVFYRDVRFVIPLSVQLWMYASPVIYPVSAVPQWLLPFYMLNPMAPIIDSYRRIILKGNIPDWNYLGLAALISGLLLVVGYGYFKRVEMKFADVI